MAKVGDSVGTAAGGTSRIFVRDATGLVREVSWVDAAMYNMIWASIPLAIAFLLLYGPGFYTGGNLYLAAVFAFLVTVGMGFLYAMMSSAVPRSGGDYTWITRALSPPVGVMSNLSWNFWISFFIGVYAVYTTSYGISPLLRLWAARFNSTGLVHAANWLVTRNGVLTVGLSVVVLSGVLLSFGRGLRGFLRLQRWAFVLWVVGAMIIPIIIMLVTSKATVLARFNHYVAQLSGPHNASALILHSSGYTTPAFSFTNSIFMLTLPFYSLAFIFQSVYFGGEIKRSRRSSLLSIPGAHAMAMVAILLSIFAFLHGAGSPFLASLALVPPAKYGFAFTPLYTEIAAVASGNVIVGSVIILGFTAMLLIFVPQTMLQLSRNAFAWSFDRLLPEKVSEVNPRTRSPIVAVAAITVTSIVSVIVIAADQSLTFLVGLFGLTLTYLAVGVAGILFPYRQREVFEASPYNKRIKGIPVMTIVAVIALVTMAAATTNLLLDANSGTNWHLNTNRVLLGALIFVAGLPIYFVIRAVQKARGINVDLAYREIPPE